MQRTTRKTILIAAIVLVAVAFFAIGLYNPLSVSEISLCSAKIEKPIRIALITDLHSTEYGKSQRKLIDLLVEQKPDLVCITGDIFDCRLTNDNTETFLSGISGIYPCYFVPGNHEFYADESVFALEMEILEKYGVIRLKNEIREIVVQGQRVNLIGVDDPESGSFDLSFAENFDKEHYSVLLSHRPEHFEDYAKLGVDLALCGHAHGGQWRIPLILENGLYAPNQGLFPKYASGLFSKGDTNMIVSRGLARENTDVPRFFNKPEIVIIELQGEKVWTNSLFRKNPYIQRSKK